MTQPGTSAFKLIEQPSAGGPRIWTLTFDLAGEKVNKLSRKVMSDFGSVLAELESLAGISSSSLSNDSRAQNSFKTLSDHAGTRSQIDALILRSAKVGHFIAGADIEMIQEAQTAHEAEALSAMGHDLSNRWEDLPFPTIASVNGVALGGGCELALASTAIVMSTHPAAKIGLPEVLLGLIPGMGGCVRLPQKVGLATALDLILTGKSLSGEKAFRAGLAEACLPQEDFEENVIQWVRANLRKLRSGERIAKEPKLAGVGGVAGSLLERTPVGRKMIFNKAREGVISKTGGKYPAPLEAIDVIKDSCVGYQGGNKLNGHERERALAREAKGFGLVAATEVSKNLINLFFLTEAVKKSNGLSQGSLATALTVKSVGVLGAGIMGGGIAQLLADRTISSRMKDLNGQALALGVQSASKLFQKQVQRKKITKRQFFQKLNLISPVLDYSGFRRLDTVIEAVIEKMEIKQKVFQELENQINDECIVVSNTSSLSITQMQSVMKHPERFAGMHFFNPVHKMPLIEVIRGERTSDQTVATVFQLSKQLGKTPIVVKDAPGFLVNRLLVPYLNEAMYLLADGAMIPEIDHALLEFGMPMGPMELIDEVGVDVGEKVLQILYQAFGGRMTPSPLTPKVVAAGRLGKKNRKGMYVYSSKGKELDLKLYEILGVSPRSGAIASEEMVERCILPMVNEAARCLEEGVVSSAAEVDLGMIMGTGFPPFRGGLLRYADGLGVKMIVDRLRMYQERFGLRFEPSAALLKRAENHEKFYRS